MIKRAARGRRQNHIVKSAARQQRFDQLFAGRHGAEKEIA
jgi:hypothetical protein